MSEDKVIVFDDIWELVNDELYNFYEADYGLRYTRYIHPMFYNGSYSEGNVCQPEEPELLMSKDEFITRLSKGDFITEGDNNWSFARHILYMYAFRENVKKSQS
jgi:hypothetical protein